MAPVFHRPHPLPRRRLGAAVIDPKTNIAGVFLTFSDWQSLVDRLYKAGYKEDPQGTLVAAGTDMNWWPNAVAQVAAMEKKGRVLSRFVGVYGFPPGPVDSGDLFCLHLVVPYARGLGVLAAGEATAYASGQTAQYHTYLAMAEGDHTLAQRYADESSLRS